MTYDCPLEDTCEILFLRDINVKHTPSHAMETPISSFLLTILDLKKIFIPLGLLIIFLTTPLLYIFNIDFKKSKY